MDWITLEFFDIRHGGEHWRTTTTPVYYAWQTGTGWCAYGMGPDDYWPGGLYATREEAMAAAEEAYRVATDKNCGQAELIPHDQP